MDGRPVLAITMGDAAGIGPEIIARALSEKHVSDACRPVVLGTAWAIEEGIRVAGASLRVRVVDAVEQARGMPGVVDLLDLHEPLKDQVQVGRVSAACGHAAVRIVEEAARLAMAGRVQAMVTCPINKEAVHLAGFEGDIGHQEILARMTGARITATMLMTPRLRVAHLSTHKSLRLACDYVRKPVIVEKLRLTHRCLVDWGMPNPRIAAAALNPHGGEAGLLGREEIEEIAPAVAEARTLGVDARGPFPADSVFNRAIAGEFDAVLAMYHDQGHIAIKVHDFEDSVTVAMGIPFIRTSVDHGTAFDIAGKGVAHHRSLVCAIDAAVQLATRGLGGSAT